MKENLIIGLFIAMIIIFAGAVTYVFKYQQPSSIPSGYKLTASAPVAQIGEKGEILVRNDCTIEEYRNCIGQIATELVELRKQIQKPPAKVEVQK